MRNAGKTADTTSLASSTIRHPHRHPQNCVRAQNADVILLAQASRAKTWAAERALGGSHQGRAQEEAASPPVPDRWTGRSNRQQMQGPGAARHPLPEGPVCIVKGLQPPAWAQDSTSAGKGHHTFSGHVCSMQVCRGLRRRRPGRSLGAGPGQGRGQIGGGVAVPVGEATLFFSGRQGRQSDFYLGWVSLCLSPSLTASV